MQSTPPVTLPAPPAAQRLPQTMQGRAQRRLVVTVRAAADIGASTTSPYVVLELGGTTLETAVALGGDNPVSRAATCQACAAAGPS